MYVSMNPKGETGKVIHISQNDTNREVEFIPYDQNGLTPLTDGQLMARINSIKGNTVSFNQLFVLTIFSNTTTDTRTSVYYNIRTLNGNTIVENFSGLGTFSSPQVVRNIISPTLNAEKILIRHSGATRDIDIRNSVVNIVGGHKYLVSANLTGTNPSVVGGLTADNFMLMDLTLMGIDNLTTTAEIEAWLSSHIADLPYFDYTQGTLISFNGTGLKTVGKNLIDISSLATTNITYSDGVLSGTASAFSNTYDILTDGINFNYKLNTKYSITVTAKTQGNVSTADNNGLCFIFKYSNNTSDYLWFKNLETEFVTKTFSSNENKIVVGLFIGFANAGGNIWDIKELQLEFGSTATAYEPYTSNTLSLPTLTYFPTGMKSAGSVYDELSDKAYTRVGHIDLTSIQTWYKGGDLTTDFWDTDVIDNLKPATLNIVASKYSVNGSLAIGSPITFIISGTGKIRIYNTGASTMDEVKSYVSGIILYYELATPTETDISLDLTYPVWNGGTEQILPVNGSTPTTSPIKANITYPDRTEDTEFLYKQTSFEWIYKSWAFVCKNITQALSVVGNALKGTIPGTMTSESGKFPLKLKMTDNDGVCFSEKIDLFVERKP